MHVNVCQNAMPSSSTGILMHLYKFDEKKNLIREKTPNWKSIFWDLCDHVVLFLISPALSWCHFWSVEYITESN